MRRRLLSERGYTLIELLLVAAIIALLAGVAAPRLYASANRSREAQAAHELRLIESALELHYLEHSFYPLKLNDLVIRGYLKETSFRSPASGHWYFYAVDDNREEGLAQAYALGAPPKNAYREAYRTLYRGKRTVPEGRNPNLKARAWLRWEVRAEESDWLRLFLKYENDSTTIQREADLPASLAHYRSGCRSQEVGRCDLITN